MEWGEGRHQKFMMRKWGRVGGRDRDRDRETDRETDRQTDSKVREGETDRVRLEST